MRRSTVKSTEVYGPLLLGETMGSATGEGQREIQAGGWAGTDDATSTAPSDEIGNPSRPEAEKSFNSIARDFEDRIQRDGEEQEQSAQRVDEQSERRDQSEHYIAEKIRKTREGSQMKLLDITSTPTVAITLLASLIASGCGSTLKDAKQRFEEPALMATWEGQCAKNPLLNLSEKPYFKFSGNFYQEVHTFYSDADCVSPAVDITYKGELTLQEANAEKVRKADFRFDHVEAAVLNTFGKDVLEKVAFCGVSTWEVNQAVNLAGKTGTLTCPLRTVPTGEFNLFKLDSEVLFLGKSGLGGGATTEESRPTTIESDRPFIKSTRKI